jgi:hypothetical protein
VHGGSIDWSIIRPSGHAVFQLPFLTTREAGICLRVPGLAGFSGTAIPSLCERMGHHHQRAAILFRGRGWTARIPSPRCALARLRADSSVLTLRCTYVDSRFPLLLSSSVCFVFRANGRFFFISFHTTTPFILECAFAALDL